MDDWRKSKITDTELLVFAQKFQNRRDWIAGSKAARGVLGYLAHRVTWARGHEFSLRCTAHMIRAKRLVGPTKGKFTAAWRSIPKEDLISTAKKFKTRNDWRKAEFKLWRAARQYGMDFFDLCCAHMVAGSNPYNSPYSIYAFEFDDKRAYVGLSFKPLGRKKEHLRTDYISPVGKHTLTGAKWTWKIVQDKIDGPIAVKKAEDIWMEKYRSAGWILLNTAKAGGVGGLANQTTNEDILLDAQSYPTKADWAAASPSLFNLAKKRGIYDQCCLHMPKRTPSKKPKKPISDETRRKMSEKATSRAADPQWRENHSKFMKGWIEENGSPAEKPEVAEKISKARLGMKFTDEHRQNIVTGKRKALQQPDQT